MPLVKLLLNRNIPNTCKILSRSTHLKWSPNSKLNPNIWNRFSELPIANCKVQTTYIWIDGTGEHLQAKSRILDFNPSSYKECPKWGFNGSSTLFTPDPKNSDVLLCPVALYKDPILQGSSKLILCETYTTEGKPTKTNTRHSCMETLNKVCDKNPMIGFEQAFMFMDADKRPFGWPKILGEPSRCSSHCYSVGADKAIGREIVECVQRCCLHCGIDMVGVHPEAVPSQWEIQLGPVVGVRAADDLWIVRYFLQRIAEIYGVTVSFEPKVNPSWPVSTCHTNFSTQQMREDGGYKYIQEAMKKLEKNHQQHMDAYDIRGSHNKQLDGDHSHFRWGVADRTGCVKVSKKVEMDKKGYFEDRRVPANADPYKVINVLVGTVCLN